MAALETAVSHLAEALAALEAQLDERLRDVAAKGDAVDQAARQASQARDRTSAAADEVRAAIGEVKSLLAAIGDL